MKCRNIYFENCMSNKKKVRVFLNNPKGTMLEGFISNFDDEHIVLDECLINILDIMTVDKRA